MEIKLIMPYRVMKYQGTTLSAFICAAIAFLSKIMDVIYTSTPFKWLLKIDLDAISAMPKVIEAIIAAAIGGIIGVLLKRLSNDMYDWLKPHIITASKSRYNKIKLYIISKFKKNGNQSNIQVEQHQQTSSSVVQED